MRGLGSSALDQIECLLRRNYDQRIDPSILKRPTGVCHSAVCPSRLRTRRKPTSVCLGTREGLSKHHEIPDHPDRPLTDGRAHGWQVRRGGACIVAAQTVPPYSMGIDLGHSDPQMAQIPFYHKQNVSLGGWVPPRVAPIARCHDLDCGAPKLRLRSRRVGWTRRAGL